MTGTVGWAVVIVVAALAQSQDHGDRQRQVPAPSLQDSPSVPTPSAPAMPGLPAVARSAKAGAKAFSRLFTNPAPAQRLEREARQALDNQKPATKIVCGMVVIEADPSIDPKILVPPPVDSGTSKLRRIVPPACTR